MDSLLRLALALFALCTPVRKEGRVISAAHHTMMDSAGAPTVFNYVGIKFCASRLVRNYASLVSYRNSGAYIQLSEIRFLDAQGTLFDYPTDMTVSAFKNYLDTRLWSPPISWSTYNTGENVGRMFDGSTSTKWCAKLWCGQTAGNPVVDYDTGESVFVQGVSYDNNYCIEKTGVVNEFSPMSLVLDVSSNPLDITVFPTWQFYNANDNASAPGRTWVEGEILGSVDGNTWWRLDVFNDLTIPNTNYALAYTGNLVPRKGDLWSDLDLAERDWTNGIAVDGI